MSAFLRSTSTSVRDGNLLHSRRFDWVELGVVAGRGVDLAPSGVLTAGLAPN